MGDYLLWRYLYKLPVLQALDAKAKKEREIKPDKLIIPVFAYLFLLRIATAKRAITIMIITTTVITTNAVWPPLCTACGIVAAIVDDATVVGSIVVVAAVDVTAGFWYWNSPTIGSGGILNVTLHVVVFTLKPTIATHVPFLSSLYGTIKLEDGKAQLYGMVIVVDTFADDMVLTLKTLSGV
jgi:hypothetical protein